MSGLTLLLSCCCRGVRRPTLELDDGADSASEGAPLLLPEGRSTTGLTLLLICCRRGVRRPTLELQDRWKKEPEPMPLALQVDCPTGPRTTHILRDLEEDAHTTRATIPSPNPPPPRLWRLGASRGQRLWRLGRGWEASRWQKDMGAGRAWPNTKSG